MLIWLVFQLSLVSSTWTLGIFIPLYVGPGSSSTCSGWSRVITSISANSQTPFYSIVNPNDGPGDHGSQPSEAFRRCIPLLRPRSDAVVLGHIDTGDKSMSNVQAEIDTYAGWDSSYRPTGIFFDGVASEASLFSQYRTHATYARGKGFNFIGLDPGEMPDSGYFGIADLVNVYESSYASFNVDENVDNSSSTPVSKQSVWLTEAPTEGSYSAVISQLAKKGVAAAYISNLREDESGIPSQWTSFAADVGRVNGDSGRSASPTTNLTVDPSQTSYSGTSNTGVLDLPQESGESPQQASDRPPVGAIAGGTIGGLLVLLVGFFIIFINRRNRRRRAYRVTGEEVARPFTDSQPSPSENSRPVLVEKWRHDTPRNFQVGASLSTWGNSSIPTTSQSGPSSSGVVRSYNGRTNLTSASTTSGESRPTHRMSNIEPPPYYSP